MFSYVSLFEYTINYVTLNRMNRDLVLTRQRDINIDQPELNLFTTDRKSVV